MGTPSLQSAISIGETVWVRISGVGGEDDAAVEASDWLSEGSGSGSGSAGSEGSGASTGETTIQGEGESMSATIDDGLLSNACAFAPPSCFPL